MTNHDKIKIELNTELTENNTVIDAEIIIKFKTSNNYFQDVRNWSKMNEVKLEILNDMIKEIQYAIAEDYD